MSIQNTRRVGRLEAGEFHILCDGVAVTSKPSGYSLRCSGCDAALTVGLSPDGEISLAHALTCSVLRGTWTLPEETVS